MPALAERPVVSKSEFAALIGVSPGRISQYIASGKISGDALVGEGRSARIDVPVAEAQLRDRLDVSQRFGANGAGTILTTSPYPGASAQPAAPTSPAIAPVLRQADTADAGIRAERLLQEQIKTRRMLEDEHARAKRYVLASDAESEMVQIAGKMMSAFESALPDFSGRVAAEFKLPQRDVLHALQAAFRSFRERAAREAGELADGLPDVVEDRGGAIAP